MLSSCSSVAASVDASPFAEDALVRVERRVRSAVGSACEGYGSVEARRADLRVCTVSRLWEDRVTLVDEEAETLSPRVELGEPLSPCSCGCPLVSAVPSGLAPSDKDVLLGDLRVGLLRSDDLGRWDIDNLR